MNLGRSNPNTPIININPREDINNEDPDLYGQHSNSEESEDDNDEDAEDEYDDDNLSVHSVVSLEKHDTKTILRLMRENMQNQQEENSILHDVLTSSARDNSRSLRDIQLCISELSSTLNRFMHMNLVNNNVTDKTVGKKEIRTNKPSILVKQETDVPAVSSTLSVPATARTNSVPLKKSAKVSKNTKLQAEFAIMEQTKREQAANTSNRYGHITTVNTQIDNELYKLRGKSIMDIVKWNKLKSSYAKNGGNLYWCDLVTPPIVLAIRHKSSLTIAQYEMLSNHDFEEHLFNLIRPTTILGWTKSFKDNMRYPKHSDSFKSYQSTDMILNDISQFAELGLDIVYVLGADAAPEQKILKDIFLKKFPPNVQEMFKESSLYDTSTTYVELCELIIRFVLDQQAREAENKPVAALLLANSATPTANNTFGSSNFQQRQLRDSTMIQRPLHRISAITADQNEDSIYGPGSDVEEDMTADERKELAANGIFAFQATPSKSNHYSATKKELDFPPHLRLPTDAINPCWSTFNKQKCEWREGRDNCPYEHDRDRVQARIDLDKRREEFLKKN